jgi:4-hydroxybenzoate-CoA ligase
MAVLYWGRHKKSSKVMLGDWLATGDVYTRDADGFYYYAGRSDDMLKVGGIWVSPVEVEGAIMELPEVLECAVVGSPDEEGLVKPRAFVVLKKGSVPSEELTFRIQEHVKKTTSKYKYPRWVEYLPELPKTATGKIQRFKLRR